MQTPLNISRSGPYFAVFFLVALIAFWLTYLSPATAPTSIYTHVHAMTSSLWMLLLIAQPLAIRTRRLALHRRLGKASLGLAPLVLVTIAAMLAAFVALQVPALFELTAGGPWQQFARWFAALPLT